MSTQQEQNLKKIQSEVDEYKKEIKRYQDLEEQFKVFQTDPSVLRTSAEVLALLFHELDIHFTPDMVQDPEHLEALFNSALEKITLEIEFCRQEINLITDYEAWKNLTSTNQ